MCTVNYNDLMMVVILELHHGINQFGELFYSFGIMYYSLDLILNHKRDNRRVEGLTLKLRVSYILERLNVAFNDIKYLYKYYENFKYT